MIVIESKICQATKVTYKTTATVFTVFCQHYFLKIILTHQATMVTRFSNFAAAAAAAAE